MSDTTPLEAEATSDIHTFDKFGRSWSVPTKQRHAHIRETKRIIREEGSMDADDIAAVYLPAEDYEALVALDVDGDSLTEFATEIAKAMGLGSSGNS